jgi:hypothetical protein
MARSTRSRLRFDFRPVIEHMGLDQFIEQVGVGRIIEEIGIGRFIEHFGVRAFIDEIGIDRWLATLSPAERRELKRRLQ